MINSISKKLEETAMAYPNKIAIMEKDKSITFRELWEKVVEVSQQLNSIKNAKINVGVYCSQNINSLIAFFAITLSGNTYVMLDANSPQERLNKIIENAEISYVLKCDDEFELINLNKDIEIKPQENNINDILYIVYTSGSTGTPKGIAKSHISILSFVESYIHEFNICDRDTIANQTPFYFDASAKDIYSMVFTGATLVLIPKEYFSFPNKLIEYLNNTQTTIISWVPSALSIVAKLNTFDFIKPIYLKKVLFVGEVFPIKYLNVWIRNLPNVEFYNLYGASEIAGVACYYKIDGEMDELAKMPIGKAYGNAKVFLLNDGKLVSKIGEQGELCISGPILASGYYNDKEKTDAIFIQNPNNSKYLEKIYLSGDMATIDETGNFVFCGRKDFQIKHMGQRIELGEIEAVCLAQKEVAECCCLYDTVKSRIFLFYCSSTLDEGAIKAKLKDCLPNYMIPNKVIKLDNMPKNANGKINRPFLKETYINI